MKDNYEKERLEAIAAGEHALDSLQKAAGELNSAGNWGIFDMLGGGFVSTYVKRSKMDNAQSYMNQAKEALQAFSRELADVDVAANLNVQTGDFLTFADYFFDGFVSDWLVQNKIDQAKSQVAEALRKIEGILAQLRAQSAL